MHRRILRASGLPFGGGPGLLLVAGAAYLAWEHEQGRHGRPHVLCAICWLNKIGPAPEAPGGSGPADASGGSGPAEPPEQT
jgi:hypothetical protein